MSGAPVELDDDSSTVPVLVSATIVVLSPTVVALLDDVSATAVVLSSAPPLDESSPLTELPSSPQAIASRPAAANGGIRGSKCMVMILARPAAVACGRVMQSATVRSICTWRPATVGRAPVTELP